VLEFSTSMKILSLKKSLSSFLNFLTLGYVMEDYLRKSIRTCSQCGRKFNVSQCGSSSGLYLFICSDITSFAQLIHLTIILYSLEQLEFKDSSFCQKIILAFSARNLEGRPFVCEMFLHGRDGKQHGPG